MTINPEQMMAAQIPVIEQHYDWRNCVSYALGLGVGLDPMDEADLPFVDETRLKVEPTMANVLGYPGFWLRELPLGLDWVKSVHGEHATRIHKPLPSKASVRGVSRVVDLIDKGEGRGALIFVERDIRDMVSGELLATVHQTVFCRGDGGFGGVNKPQPAPHAIPERAPDASIDMPTSPQSALIYRLSGDYNPLHSNPETARQAGFPRPILHGLATFGVTGHGLVKRWCDGDPTAVRAMSGRFSSPVFPGETVRVDIWREAAGRASFRASVPARGVVVVNNGHFEFAA
jgi:acyl dehydratase